MISEIIQLGKSLEPHWDRDSFPEVALETLSGFEATTSLEEFEQQTAQWLLGLNELPDQLNLYNTFGEPPVTFFNNGKFAVDLYFWRKNDTLIHSHAFRGAFKVLFGKSLHEEFEVEVKEQLESDIVSSQLTTSKTKIMNAGDTQIIKPGMQLVHRVLHLDNPTLTLCLRTVEDVELNQWHHLSSGLSYIKHNLSQLTIKQVLYFQYLYLSDPKSAEDYLKQTLDRLPLSAQLSLYESIFLNQLGLEHEVSCLILDTVRVRCEGQKWFQQYEDHYSELATHLFEHHASSGDLKLLAHAINCNYSESDVMGLLGLKSTQELMSLSEKLLNEESIFDSEHYETQTTRIKNFIS